MAGVANGRPCHRIWLGGSLDDRSQDRGSDGSHRAGVDVRSRDVKVGRSRADVGVHDARRRFGGIDFPASLVGMLAALALMLLLGGLVGAVIGGIGYQMGLEGDRDLSIAGLIAGVFVLFLSFFVGGWAAGRMARYDGAKNGFMTALWTLLVAGALAGLGAWLGAEYNVFDRLALPRWFSSDGLAPAALVTGLLSLLAMFAGAILGGVRGEHYHRRADAVIASTREGGLRSTWDEKVVR